MTMKIGRRRENERRERGHGDSEGEGREIETSGKEETGSEK